MLISSYFLAYSLLVVWSEPILEASWNFPFILGSLFLPFLGLFMDVDVSLGAFVAKMGLTIGGAKNYTSKQVWRSRSSYSHWGKWDLSWLLSPGALLGSDWRFPEQHQLCLEESNINPVFSRNFLESRMTFNYSLFFLKSHPLPC